MSTARALIASAVISAGALGILKPFLEVHEGVRYVGYLDPVGVPTTCVGSTKGAVVGKKYSKEECDQRLYADIQEAARIFKVHVPKEVRDNMHPKSEAMFISFIFHYGPGGKGRKDGFVFLKRGTHSTMYNKLQVGDVEGACREFPKWNANNLRGIEKRNLLSESICLEGVKENQL